jgi:hypothetical protein
VTGTYDVTGGTIQVRDNTTFTGTLKADGATVIIRDSKVQNLTARGQSPALTFNNAEISGTLTINAPSLQLSGVTIGNIQVERAEGSTQQFSGGQSGRRNIDTGGGAFIGGRVNTGGGDFVGRDKVVHGDQVSGDKVGRNRLGSTSTTEEATQVIRLKSGVVVSGDITFEDGKGLVVVEPGAQFTGRVIGGQKELAR